MTEQDWLTCNDPQRMLVFLGKSASDRKLQLFACACCRRIWHLLSDDRSRQAVETAESFVDGRVSTPELEAAAEAASEAHHQERSRNREIPEAEQDEFALHPSFAAYNAAIPSGWWGGAPVFVAPYDTIRGLVSDQQDEGAAQCELLRDMFGPLPFRSVVVEPAWSTPTVKGIAEAIYIDRAFERLPILADALEEAGCVSVEILTHCRKPAPHVRGCWLVDLLYNHLDKAARLWSIGKSVGAGRLIFEQLPVDAQPKWAGRILRLALERSGIAAEPLIVSRERPRLERLLEIIDCGHWALGHRCFDNLRDLTLHFDEMRRRRGLSQEEDTLAIVLVLAEQVAKVTYNAVDPGDPFDHDSGWYIASFLRALVDSWQDEEFARAAWVALSCEQ